MSQAEPIYLQALRNGWFVTGTAFSRALGMTFVSVGPGEGVLKLSWREDLVGDAETGVLAGGVVTAMLDHVSGMAVIAALTEPGTTATLDLRIDYLRPAHPGQDLFAAARCVRVTHSVAFVRASAYEDSPDDPVATAQGTFALQWAQKALG